MLSYRHAFHAGNHADVLKHVVLAELLRYLAEKAAPLCYIDTHAGAGRFDLLAKPAERLAEYRDGIGRLWAVDDLPGPLARYVDLVRRENPDGELRWYPGSPLIAERLLRADDRLWLAELHPADHEALRQTFAGAGRRTKIERRDGLAWLKALLPPASRRALVMVDPSYEVKDDYRAVAAAIAEARARFATGVYVAWYPLLARRESARLPGELQRVAGDAWLRAEIILGARRDTGMHGSGLVVVNPPWTLPDTLDAALPRLADLLARDDRAGWRLEAQIP